VPGECHGRPFRVHDQDIAWCCRRQRQEDRSAAARGHESRGRGGGKTITAPRRSGARRLVRAAGPAAGVAAQLARAPWCRVRWGAGS
jgi:hypothetical protein